MANDAGHYRLAPLAESDLEDIWDYTAENWSKEQAERYHRGIVAVMEELAAGAKSGRPIDIREGYFKYPVGSHFVFFQQSDEGIAVIRILHQSMDTDRHL